MAHPAGPDEDTQDALVKGSSRKKKMTRSYLSQIESARKTGGVVEAPKGISGFFNRGAFNDAVKAQGRKLGKDNFAPSGSNKDDDVTGSQSKLRKFFMKKG